MHGREINIQEVFEDSTCHGTLYMFASKSWAKRIFWGVVLLVAIGAFVYVTITHIITLAGNPISTSITLTTEHQLLSSNSTHAHMHHSASTHLNNFILVGRQLSAWQPRTSSTVQTKHTNLTTQ